MLGIFYSLDINKIQYHFNSSTRECTSTRERTLVLVMSNGADDRPVAVVQAVRYKKQDGVLVLTKDSLGWSPEGNSELALNVSYTKIKSETIINLNVAQVFRSSLTEAHRLSKETGKKYQLQLVYHDGSTANLHFAGDAPKEERQKISQLLLQLVPNVTQKASSDLEAKKALLQSDPNLYQLYRDLVIPGIISTEEFWANRIVSCSVVLCV